MTVVLDHAKSKDVGETTAHRQRQRQRQRHNAPLKVNGMLAVRPTSTSSSSSSSSSLSLSSPTAPQLLPSSSISSLSLSSLSSPSSSAYSCLPLLHTPKYGVASGSGHVNGSGSGSDRRDPYRQYHHQVDADGFYKPQTPTLSSKARRLRPQLPQQQQQQQQQQHHSLTSPAPDMLSSSPIPNGNYYNSPTRKCTGNVDNLHSSPHSSKHLGSENELQPPSQPHKRPPARRVSMPNPIKHQPLSLWSSSTPTNKSHQQKIQSSTVLNNTNHNNNATESNESGKSHFTQKLKYLAGDNSHPNAHHPVHPASSPGQQNHHRSVQHHPIHATPQALIRPSAAAFKSTGSLTKKTRKRNIAAGLDMPETPIKRPVWMAQMDCLGTGAAFPHHQGQGQAQGQTNPRARQTAQSAGNVIDDGLPTSPTVQHAGLGPHARDVLARRLFPLPTENTNKHEKAKSHASTLSGHQNSDGLLHHQIKLLELGSPDMSPPDSPSASATTSESSPFSLLHPTTKTSPVIAATSDPSTSSFAPVRPQWLHTRPITQHSPVTANVPLLNQHNNTNPVDYSSDYTGIHASPTRSTSVSPLLGSSLMAPSSLSAPSPAIKRHASHSAMQGEPPLKRLASLCGTNNSAATHHEPDKQYVKGQTTPSTADGTSRRVLEWYTLHANFLNAANVINLIEGRGESSRSAPVDNPTGTFEPWFETRFVVHGQLGAGAFADTYQAQDREVPHNMFAVKVARHPFTGSRDRVQKLEEVYIGFKIGRSKRCVELQMAWEQSGRLYQAMELCAGGNLEALLNDRADLPVDMSNVWRFTEQIGEGLQWMHSKDIIHLDLKPSNILVVDSYNIKIGDYGCAIWLGGSQSRDREGDRNYMAPELLKGQIGKAADIFSLGLIALEMTANVNLPTHGDDWMQLRHGDLSGVPWEPGIDVDIELVQLIKGMITEMPAERLVIETILTNIRQHHNRVCVESPFLSRRPKPPPPPSPPSPPRPPFLSVPSMSTPAAHGSHAVPHLNDSAARLSLSALPSTVKPRQVNNINWSPTSTSPSRVSNVSGFLKKIGTPQRPRSMADAHGRSVIALTSPLSQLSGSRLSQLPTSPSTRHTPPIHAPHRSLGQHPVSNNSEDNNDNNVSCPDRPDEHHVNRNDNSLEQLAYIDKDHIGSYNVEEGNGDDEEEEQEEDDDGCAETSTTSTSISELCATPPPPTPPASNPVPPDSLKICLRSGTGPDESHSDAVPTAPRVNVSLALPRATPAISPLPKQHSSSHASCNVRQAYVGPTSWLQLQPGQESNLILQSPRFMQHRSGKRPSASRKPAQPPPMTPRASKTSQFAKSPLSFHGRLLKSEAPPHRLRSALQQQQQNPFHRQIEDKPLPPSSVARMELRPIHSRDLTTHCRVSSYLPARGGHSGDKSKGLKKVDILFHNALTQSNENDNTSNTLFNGFGRGIHHANGDVKNTNGDVTTINTQNTTTACEWSPPISQQVKEPTQIFKLPRPPIDNARRDDSDCNVMSRCVRGGDDGDVIRSEDDNGMDVSPSGPGDSYGAASNHLKATRPPQVRSGSESFLFESDDLHNDEHDDTIFGDFSTRA